MKHEFENHKISVFEPFSDFLLGDTEEKQFEITFLDVVRFAGHACPSMTGAFLISQRVVEEFYPETKTCIRGEIKAFLPTAATAGATGPMANVFGFILGCWGQTGFGGLKNEFIRRDLLQFARPDIPLGSFRFQHVPTKKTIDITYNPNLADFVALPNESFQQQWRKKIKSILEAKDRVLSVKNI